MEDFLDGTFRVDNRGARARYDMVAYSENGHDETTKGRQRFDDQQRGTEGDLSTPDERLHLPFLTSEQPKYLFRVGQSDPRDRSLIRIFFDARKPAKNLGNGSAWINAATGEIVSIGVRQSKSPMFVRYFDATFVFGANMVLGRGVSEITFDTAVGVAFLQETLSRLCHPVSVRDFLRFAL